MFSPEMLTLTRESVSLNAALKCWLSPNERSLLWRSKQKDCYLAKCLEWVQDWLTEECIGPSKRQIWMVWYQVAHPAFSFSDGVLLSSQGKLLWGFLVRLSVTFSKYLQLVLKTRKDKEAFFFWVRDWFFFQMANLWKLFMPDVWSLPFFSIFMLHNYFLSWKIINYF